ncbi:MAG: ATP-dependent helicase [Bacteroidetes bacterium]|nr:ATP-dependent helicase [Bacteroidota bacterium]
MKKYVLQSQKTTPLRLVKPEHFRIDYRRELNEAQYEAVTSTEGPHLIIAGAGTGKTRTIVYRVAYLVECGVKPDTILLLTFTRKAAQEMLRKASLLLDRRCEHVSGGTFHSFANSILRRYAKLVGYETNYTILDQTDAEDVVNLLRTKLKYDAKEKRFPRKETLYDLYSRSVNTLVPLPQLLLNEYPQFLELEEDIQKLYQVYVHYKRQHNLMDYDDLLFNCATLLREHDDVRRVLEERFRYVMVDEYQDTNRIQAEIIKLLSQAHRNIMVVGDDAQCIYSFRGSTIHNILTFPNEYPDCKIIKLEENFRSTQPILNLANAILNRNDILKHSSE